MNVVDIPQPSQPALYDEAVARYAALVKNRAIGVHTVAVPEHPELSEIRLLVVTTHIGLDNRFFFSPFQRLPERYHRLFLQEPFILPAWSLRVMSYTPYERRTLVAGRDVLEPYQANDEPVELWCRALKDYAFYAAFVAKTQRVQELNGRETLAHARAFGRALADAARVIPEARNTAYGGEIAALHREYLRDGCDRVAGVHQAWRVFFAAFERFDAILRDRLKAANTEQAVAISRELLRGEEHSEHFDREYAFRRARDIDGYMHELASLGFPYGHLFFVGAHPRVGHAQPDATVLDVLLRTLYGMRRRFEPA